MNNAFVRPSAAWIPASLIVLATIACPALVEAQTGSAADSAAINAVKGRLAAVQTQRDLEPALKAQIVETYENAIAALESANSLRAEINQTKKIAAGAQDTIRRLERELRAVRAESASPQSLQKIQELPLDALERLESRAREEAEQARLRVAELQRRYDEIVARPLSARLEQAELREEAAKHDSQATERVGGGVPATLAAAQRDLARARGSVRQARLARVEQEMAAQPALARIAQLELYIAQATLDVREADWRRVRALLGERQRAEIAKAREEAARARQPGVGPPDPALALQARALERRAQVAEASLAVSEALGTLSERREQLAEVEQMLRATKRRAATITESGELDKLLLRQLGALPTPDQFRKAAERRADAIAKAADARLDVELERAKLADLERAVAEATTGLDPGLSAESRVKIERRVRADVTELQRLLERVDKELDVLLQTLRATDEAESTLLRRTQDVREELVRLLLWIPVQPVGLGTFGAIGPAAKWIVSGDNWSSVTETWRRAAQRDPVLLLLAALVLIGLLAARGWFKRKLPTLAPGAIPLHAFRLRHTLEALALSLLLALPAPFAIWMAGFLLETTHNAPLFTQGAGVAFRLTAEVVLFFRAIRWLFDPGGVAIKHFGWQAEPVLAANRGLQQLMVVYVPLAFLAILGTIHAPEPVRQSLGRIAFVLAMIALAILWRRALRPDRPLVRVDRDESAIGLRFIRALVIRAPVWFGAGLAVLALTGFYLLAAYLHRIVLETILLVFSVAMIYGLISLWLGVQRLRLAEVEAQQASAAAEREPAASDEAPLIRPDEIDAEAIDAQTAQLLNMIVTVVIGAGLWLIWSRAFVALDFGIDWSLWSYTETVDGKTVTRTISLAGVLLAGVVGAVAYIVTRNIGGMLDILLLQRLRLQADANYAIKTVARYATAGVGIFLAANLIGVNWSSVQWLVAALGVGLGFGLQEIVANFVSGIIVLGERPIRIGDWVTVGETSGTVTRIRARATVITDWDNKEVLIPNKAFITERVINWTLSNQTTRLLLKIGVAYGTDPVRAQAVLAETVRANPEVLKEPAPSIYFMGFGDSSLDFEIRAYVDATNKRLRTMHELNTAMAAALADAGIEIPFPQRDLHIRSAEGLDTLGRGEKPQVP
ncbi:MAG: mechanosensitive ion channel [Betaproteobacteria bacterium]|jgi:potassium efflux system protein|nr:mechanosensitive ion channel [Betaproteobacteria bacterium]